MKQWRLVLALLGLGIGATLGVYVGAQDGGGPEGGGGLEPAGSDYATQYNATGGVLGGAGPGSAGEVLTSNGAGMAPTFEAAGGTPGGMDTQVQYNDSGAFGGDAGLTYNDATNALTLTGALSVGSCTGCGGATETVGTFNLNLDNGCTTTPVITVNYYTVEDIVHWYFVTLTGFACTSDSTSFRTTGLDVPAAMRPENAVLIPIRFGVEDGGGAEFLGTMLINTTGDVLFGRCTVVTDTGCSTTNWTNAGAGKNLAVGSFSFTYSINTNGS